MLESPSVQRIRTRILKGAHRLLDKRIAMADFTERDASRNMLLYGV
jgi:hypothetical protein